MATQSLSQKVIQGTNGAAQKPTLFQRAYGGLGNLAGKALDFGTSFANTYWDPRILTRSLSAQIELYVNNLKDVWPALGEAIPATLNALKNGMGGGIFGSLGAPLDERDTATKARQEKAPDIGPLLADIWAHGGTPQQALGYR